jgi:hypothetical protein
MAGATLDVDRTRVLAYRVAAQQLDRTGRRPGELAVLDLGVQDTPYGSARLALAARTDAAPDDDTLELVWSTRGAPHLHRRADLPALAAALWPLDDADATTRIATTSIREGARLGLAAFTAAAEAMRAVVTARMPKGEVSTEVSARVPEALTYHCQACRARHISGALFQQVGLAAGVRVEPTGSSTFLAPIGGWPGVPAAAAGTDTLIAAYLRMLGPASPGDAARFVGTTRTALGAAWPSGLTEVRVDGRRAWLPDDRVGALRSAPRPEQVRLLPPSDPFLQARDRDLIVPDRARRAAVWRIISNPGALLVDGEVAGTWRARTAGRNRLDVTVAPFAPLPARVRAAVDEEAARVAAARAADEVRVHLDPPA